MTRIGFDATVLAPATRYTGAGEYALRLLQHLGDESSRVDVVAYGWPASSKPDQLASNIDWRPLPRLPLGKVSQLAMAYAVLPRIARADGLDVFHAPTVHTRASLPPVPRRLGCGLVVTIHDVIPLTYYTSSGAALPWRLRAFYRWNLRSALKAQHVITVSETSRREIIDATGADPASITTIHNGGSLPSDYSNDVEGHLNRFDVRRPFVLYVGSCEPRKNVAALIEAYEAAARRGLDIDLVLVSSVAPPYGPPLRALAERQSYASRIKFLDCLDDAALDALYRAAALLAFPSLYEGFGLPPLHAIERGTPVVASRSGSLPEVLGDAAEYVEPYDVTSIADGLVRVVSDKARQDQLIEAGLRQARLYSWHRAAQTTMDVYERVAIEMRSRANARRRLAESDAG